MRFIVDPSHTQHYKEKNYIEFEELISDEEANTLCEKIKKYLSSFKTTESRFIEGRDMREKDPFISKIVKQKSFASIATKLLNQNQVRLVFDQGLYLEESPFEPLLFFESLTAERVTSFKGIYLTLILRLTEPDSYNKWTNDYLPKKKGSGLFLSKKAAFHLGDAFEKTPQAFLLIAYGKLKTLYVHNPLDPCTHLLKNKGYGFGDNLNDTHHPAF